MRRSRASRLAASALALAVTTSQAWGHGCRFEKETDYELETMLWSPASARPNAPVIYVIGAPWCPYTKGILEQSRRQNLPFELRFVLLDAPNELNKDQVVDAALNRSPAALERILFRGEADISKITPANRELILEVQDATMYALRTRMELIIKEAGKKNIGWPYVVGTSANRFTVGMNATPTWGKAYEYLGPTAPRSIGPNPLRRFIATGVGPVAPASGAALAKANGARIRVLPHDKALSAYCLEAGRGLRITGTVDVDGHKWFVFNPLTNRKTRMYGRVSDFNIQ